MTSIELKIPILLDLMIVWPVLLYRLLRYGWPYRKIPLGEGRFTIVDPSIFYRLNKFHWIGRGENNLIYAVRFVPGKATGFTAIRMHREIMNAAKGVLVDHRNNKTLDNRVANLRFATYSQNACNTLKRRTKTSSQYRGVCWSKYHRKWGAKIFIQNKAIFLGYFDSEIDAAKAYDTAAGKYHGEFAKLNLPEQ